MQTEQISRQSEGVETEWPSIASSETTVEEVDGSKPNDQTGDASRGPDRATAASETSAVVGQSEKSQDATLLNAPVTAEARSSTVSQDLPRAMDHAPRQIDPVTPQTVASSGSVSEVARVVGATTSDVEMPLDVEVQARTPATDVKAANSATLARAPAQGGQATIMQAAVTVEAEKKAGAESSARPRDEAVAEPRQALPSASSPTEARPAPAGPTVSANPAAAQPEVTPALSNEGRSFEQTINLESGRSPSWRLGAEATSALSTRTAEMQSATTARPQTVAQQLSVAVSSAQNGQVEVRLDPAELGRVQIQLQTSEDGVRAVVMAERAETQDLLRRNSDVLTRDLEEAGFNSISLDFTGGNETGERSDENAHQAHLSPTSGDDTLPDVSPRPETTPQRYSQTTGLTSLDIRL
ncbi:flagellar hook-length control protein FliK [Amaricoccus macauensis]|uniref:flagellar hook-length control protein FliK n=1 Tax=Amaricoccus macauensis TaxID=57001 RepID=UPI003C7DC0E3